MSVLVACRGLASAAASNVDHVPITTLTLPVELAVWYAGFPDDIPVVATPGEFERVVEHQLAAGDLEPAARLVRHSRAR